MWKQDSKKTGEDNVNNVAIARGVFLLRKYFLSPTFFSFFSFSEFEGFQKSLKKISPWLQFVVSVDDPGRTLSTSGTVRQEIIARLMGVLKEAITIPAFSLTAFDVVSNDSFLKNPAQFPQVDGVELNVTAGSKERLVHFVKGLKDELVRKSYNKRVFLVLPTNSEELAKQFDLKELTK